MKLILCFFVAFIDEAAVPLKNQFPEIRQYMDKAGILSFLILALKTKNLSNTTIWYFLLNW